jgi:beta-lactamase regulating signal transducer with metallopeptidase domain
MFIWFIETMVVATLLAAIALLASRYLRLSPVARHALWLVVLIKLIAPPIVSWPWSARFQWPVRETATVQAGSVGMASIYQRDIKSITAARPRREPNDFILTSLIAPQRSSPSNAAQSTKPLIAKNPPVVHTAQKLVRSQVTPLPSLTSAEIRWLVVTAWVAASLGWLAWQASRISRFQQSLSLAKPAPEWLVAEADGLASTLGVRTPQIMVVPNLPTPVLWFLGRPQLFLPSKLVSTLGLAGWRGILAHELAHLRRWDHWVRRLELMAGVLWWWNPLYWLTRRRIEIEAELACDEWAVRAFPEGRFAYAEALLQVCHSLTLTNKPPAPALGVAGAGRFLERRVTMIVRDQTPTRASMPVLISTAVLALLALPAWSAPGSLTTKSATPLTLAPSSVAHPTTLVALEDNVAIVDDDEDDDKPTKPTAPKAKKPTTRTPKPKAKGDSDDKTVEEIEAWAEKFGKEMEAMFGEGSEFQKQMEELGPKIEKAMKVFEKEIEEKFGPEFEKKIFEKFGPGSEFSEKLGKKFSEKFGPGSDFEKSIKENFGPDFEKKMKDAFGPDSEMTKKLQKLAKESKPAKTAKKAGATTKPEPKNKKREQSVDAKRAQRLKEAQIKAIREQIEKLSKQLEQLEDQDDEADDKDIDVEQ